MTRLTYLRDTQQVDPWARLNPAGHSSSEPIIHMSGVEKVYVTGVGEFPALRDVNLDFYPGEFVSIVGRSGSGKSTLVNMITGIDRPTAGMVEIAGTRVHDLREGDMSRWRGRNLGIVFQFYQLLPMLSLLENTMLPMDFCGMYAAEEREPRARELLQMVGLKGLEHKVPAAVSGGQQQSAAIARALANDPPILIADEPTGKLDSQSAERVYSLFEALAARGKTVIVVTHDPSLARRVTRTVHLVDGHVVDA